MTQIAGRVAFVTGGAAGIGLGIARALLAGGARVAIADIRQDALDRATRELDAGGRLLPVQLDVTDRAGYVAAVDAAEAALGPVEVLCNNAGVGVTGPIKNATFDDWDWLQRVLLGGVVNGVMTVLPRMRERGNGGHIVNTASMAGLFRAGDAGIYITLKYAVVGMAEALRAELIDESIGVSAFVPGPTRTDIYWSHRLRPPGMATGYAEIDAAREQTGAEVWSENEADDFLKDPAVVGRRVVEGIIADDLFIFGHSAFREAIERRHEALMRAIPKVPLSDGTIERARRLNENSIYDLQRIVPPIVGEGAATDAASSASEA